MSAIRTAKGKLGNQQIFGTAAAADPLSIVDASAIHRYHLDLANSGSAEIHFSSMAKYAGKGAQPNGSVYVCNLPEGTDENMLAEYFGTIGLIKKDKRTARPKIWLYRDKATNEPKGDATITYEDPYAASAAVEWFHNKDFHGEIIRVSIAESKSKDDTDTSIASDFGGLESTREANGADGRGKGRGDASGKTWQQDGDWLCPNTSCGNVNFAYRGVCNRCGSARPVGASGGGGAGRGKGRGGPDAAGGACSVGGPTGLFGPNDWQCPMCANINWAKRPKCNICNTNKPGVSDGGVRGGRGGGYKELDEDELEEVKRRRREAEEDDGEMYDEFGNLKKKYRAKSQQAEVGKPLPESGRALWDIEDRGAAERDRDGRERSRDHGRNRDEREGSRNREHDDSYRRRSRSRERERGRDRDRDRAYDYNRDGEYGRDRDRYRYR
ncbi:Transcription initiation factor TFIID subunit 15-like protein [Drosera capensis]